jgi:SAM-dependent methyltransferase
MTCLGDAAEIVGGGRSTFYKQVLPESRYSHLRRLWEWDFVAECAETSDVLDRSAVAIGLGVGREPLMYYFARRCAEVIATDLYGSDSAWEEARVETVDAILEASPLDYPRERLKVRNADMRALGVPDASIDFAWSCSSLEHVPTLFDVVRVLDELARVLRDRGLAILTTEYCVTEPPYLLPGLNAWDESFVSALRDGYDIFEFVGPVDLNYNWVHPANGMAPRQVRREGVNTSLKNALKPLFHAGPMLVPVGISGLVPIAFVLRRRSRKAAPFWRHVKRKTWETIRVPDHVRTYTQALEHLQAGQPQEARHLLLSLVTQLRDFPPQFQLHVFRAYADATARVQALTATALADEIIRFCDRLAPGEFQDADCLDLFAHLVWQASRPADALDILKRAIGSPSTTYTHAVRLGVNSLRIARDCDQVNEAREISARVVADCLLAGAPAENVLMTLRGTNLAETVGCSEAEALLNAISEMLEEAGAAAPDWGDLDRRGP